MQSGSSNPATTNSLAGIAGSEAFPDRLVDQRFDHLYPDFASYQDDVDRRLIFNGARRSDADDLQLLEFAFARKVGAGDCAAQIDDDRSEIEADEPGGDGEFDEGDRLDRGLREAEDRAWRAGNED